MQELLFSDDNTSLGCQNNLIRVKRFSLYDYESKYEMPAPLSFLFLGYREEVWLSLIHI